MERTPGASGSLCVRAKNPNKFWFSANGMRTIRKWRSAGLHSCPHIRTFGSRTIRRARVYAAEKLRTEFKKPQKS